MKRFLRNNGLTLVLVILLLASLCGGQFFAAEATTENGESEFLAIGSMVVLSIFQREKNSPESKAVDAPHQHTG